MSKFLIFYLFILTPTIIFCFSPDLSSFDTYGSKLAVNDILLVEYIPAQSSFFLCLAPFNYSLSCTIPCNDSDQYVYTVALNRQAGYNDSIRFVFIGVNMKTNVPFIGSLTYTGISGIAYVDTVKSSRKVKFSCDGWQTNNYRIHEFDQFINNSDAENTYNDFFVVTVS